MYNSIEGILGIILWCRILLDVLNMLEFVVVYVVDGHNTSCGLQGVE